MSKFLLSPLAEKDLEEIWFYTFKTWGKKQANLYLSEFESAFTSLASNPLQAVACDEIRAGYRYWSLNKHLIFFKINKDNIEIIRILHNKMNAFKALQ